jgi:hypothetical protein
MVSGSLSITKPGLTPVPRSATFAARATCCSFSRTSVSSGYDSSSQVETTCDPAASSASSCPATSRSREPVEWQTTSALPCTSRVTGTPTLRPRPITSPRSLPILSGSTSTAPTTLIHGLVSSSRAISAPMGPMPY